MTPAIAALVVHGMGTQPPTFADRFVRAIDERLARSGIPAGSVHWRAAYWADLVQSREQALWDDLSRAHDLDYAALRRFVITHFGDALAYQRVPLQDSDFYRDIHARIAGHLAAIRRDVGADLPLVVLAHSLGSVIMSNFIWDVQQGRDQRRGAGSHNAMPPLTPLERMETLAGFITFGSSIALFTLCLRDIVAIRFPPPELPEPLRQRARWLNVYDADDVFAYPLRPLSPTYAAAVHEDVELNVGGPLRSWNPLSHNAYWTDPDFAARAAEVVGDLLKG
ncbi:MAG: hypothetical protein ACREON_05345 [Gemmatimonadaceae bacterium]